MRKGGRTEQCVDGDLLQSNTSNTHTTFFSTVTLGGMWGRAERESRQFPSSGLLVPIAFRALFCLLTAREIVQLRFGRNYFLLPQGHTRHLSFTTCSCLLFLTTTLPSPSFLWFVHYGLGLQISYSALCIAAARLRPCCRLELPKRCCSLLNIFNILRCTQHGTSHSPQRSLHISSRSITSVHRKKRHWTRTQVCRSRST